MGAATSTQRTPSTSVSGWYIEGKWHVALALATFEPVVYRFFAFLPRCSICSRGIAITDMSDKRMNFDTCPHSYITRKIDASGFATRRIAGGWRPLIQAEILDQSHHTPSKTSIF